jgi:oxygen-dependent protoporphyrinogen oxidase
MNKRTPSCVVVGGGFAGLTAGYHLRKAGWDVTLLEAAGHVGGRVGTERKRGYVLDTGATQISSGYKAYLALCNEVGLGEEIVRSSQHVGIIRDGRIFEIDGESMLSGAFSPVLSLRGKWALLRTLKDFMSLRPSMDVLDVSANHAVDVETARDYALRRLGQEVYDVLVDPMVRAYVMRRADTVSALEWFSTLRNLGGATMLSLCGGNDRLPKALAGHIDVCLNARALDVRREGERVVVAWQAGDGSRHALGADACVLATRLPEAMVLHEPLRAIAGPLGEVLSYNRGLVVHLGYRQRPACRAVGLLLGAKEHDEIGLVWLEHNKNTDRAPPGHSLFSVYFDEAANERCFSLPEVDLAAIAGAFLEKLFPELRGARDLTRVTRWPLAIPHPAPGVYREVHRMKSRLLVCDPVQLAGDYFTCVGQNSAIHYGRVAAERLLARHAAGVMA